MKKRYREEQTIAILREASNADVRRSVSASLRFSTSPLFRGCRGNRGNQGARRSVVLEGARIDDTGLTLHDANFLRKEHQIQIRHRRERLGEARQIDARFQKADER